MEKQMNNGVIGLGILVGIIIFLIFLFWFFTSEVLLAFIAGASPTVVLVYLQNRKENKEHRNWLLRNKKACLAEIVDIFMSLLQDKESNEKRKSAKLFQRIQYLQPALLVWGSPSTLRAWNEMQEISSDGDSENAIRRAEKFFRVIRKELGHSDSSLKPGEVLATILKPEEKKKALDVCKGEVYKGTAKT